MRRVGWIAEEEGTPGKRWSNLVGEDCFHSVLKLKRSEDQRPRFESRLSAEDNQTESDLFFFYPHRRNPRHHPPTPPGSSFFYTKTGKQRTGEGKFEIRTSGDAINSPSFPFPPLLGFVSVFLPFVFPLYSMRFNLPGGEKYGEWSINKGN